MSVYSTLKAALETALAGNTQAVLHQEITIDGNKYVFRSIEDIINAIKKLDAVDAGEDEIVVYRARFKRP